MGSSGCVKTAIRRAAGRACFSIASRFPAIWPAAFDTPVTEPPGRFRLGTNPEPTGSPTSAITIGIFVLASMAACVPGVWSVTMTSAPARTNSVASDGAVRACRRLNAPQARYSGPRDTPVFRGPEACAAAPTRSDGVNRPTRRGRSLCCARAANGSAAAVPPSPAMKSRRLMLCRLSSRRCFWKERGAVAHVRFGSLGDIRRQLGDVCFTPKADIRRLGSDVRFVPIAAICTAAISIAIRSPRRRGARTDAPLSSAQLGRMGVTASRCACRPRRHSS